MEYRILDMSKDPRREHFEYFRGMANPYVGTTVQVDVTELIDWHRRTGRPFFLSLLYCAVRAANAVPALRRRIIDGQAVEFERCDASYTVLREDGSYGFCRANCMRPFEEYLAEATARHERAKAEPEGYAEDETDLLFVSCLPWVRYVSLQLPTPVPADSNPRVTWGQYAEEGGRVTLPVSLLANHALVDGLHIGQFYAALEEQVRALILVGGGVGRADSQLLPPDRTRIHPP